MRKTLFILVLFLVAGAIVFYSACVKPPQYSVVPSITFKNFSSNTIKENTDTVDLVFSFTDGDGDLGPVDPNDQTLDIFLTDSRDNTVKYNRLPNITPEGNIKAISGTVTIKIFGLSCRANVTNDQLSYKIQVQDRAGHLSNTVQTSVLTIDCQ